MSGVTAALVRRHAPPLLAGLFDDASLFPPASTPLAEAVAGHVAWRAGKSADLVGPFVCPAGRWQEVAAEPGDFPVAVTVPEPGGIEDVVAQVGDRLAWIELAPAAAAGIARCTRCHVPAGLPVFVEVPVAAVTEPLCVELRQRGLWLKLRTGGTSAEAFPDEWSLARALYAAVRVDVPAKLTAGLHHAVRHRDPVTGFEHHGFLNVLLAVDTAVSGGELAAVHATLAEQDAAVVADRVRALDDAAGFQARRIFHSFGTCSIAEPLADLRELGLLGPGSR